MSTGLADRPAIDIDAWDCRCGHRCPLGISLCPKCGRPSPYGEVFVPSPRGPKKIRSIRLALGVILLNVISQIVMVVLVHAGRMETSRAINLGIWMGLGFYGLVLVIIAGPLTTLRPRWLRGNPQTAPVLGIEVGLAAAAFLVVLLWIGTGHPVVDPGAQALVSEGSFVRILLAFAVIAVAAPLVEELLFRGVVAESLGRNGATIAIGVSSFLFALAHLRSLGYYTGCGIVLGLLYWRRGLWASIAAHATFNGCLVILALVVALGPARMVSNGGVTVRAGADWQLIDGVDAPPNSTLALQGPSGSSILVSREDIPLGAPIPSPERVAAAMNSGSVPLPAEAKLLPGGAHVVTYPAGRGVQLAVKVGGHSGVVVILTKGNTVWEIEVATAGSARAEREYPAILRSLTLPGGNG
jgi:membrane protease YdiL (CAAX protease family)